MAHRRLIDKDGDRERERPAAAPEREAAPPLGSVAGVLWLQRAAGNAATRALMRDDTKTKPKTDEEIWEEDWANADYAAARKHFEGEDRPTGDAHFRYMHLAPLYKSVKGIDRPLKWVHENIKWGTFYGHGTYMHKDLKTALGKAETELKKTVKDAPFKKLWAFNPRTQTGGQWSNHADGKAIDFDEVTNPRLLDKDDRAVISALTGMDISAANPGKEMGLSSYAAGREASTRFQDRYSEEGMTERIDEITDEEAVLKKEGDALSVAIAAIPTGKKKGEPKPTAEQKADAKRLKQELTAKQAEMKAAAASRKALEKELASYQALEKAITDLLTEATELSASVDVLEAQLSSLEAGESIKEGEAPLTGKALTKEVEAHKALIKKKSAQWKVKQKALEDKMKARDDDTLHGYAERGFLDLDERLVDALRAAGLGWGGDYSGPKDFMHFEVT